MAAQHSILASPDAGHGASSLLGVEQAKARILDAVAPVRAVVRVGLRECLNRVLAEPVLSPMNVPPFANSAMDGYALRAADVPQEGGEWVLIGTAYAGRPFAGEVGAGQCVRIMTGAVLPVGADSVVMQEHVSATDERIRVAGPIKAGQHVRLAGEDLAQAARVFEAGRRLQPADAGVLASIGMSEVPVFRRLRVAFFSTGDELRPVGSPLAPGQIYDSNRYTLHAMLQRLGVELLDFGAIGDQRQQIERAFRSAAESADVLITSGGVSVGAADHVQEVLADVGRVNFWRIAMKPGKPLAVGSVGNAQFFGLPGNPVSVMATFYQFVLPALRKMAGEQVVAPLTLRLPCMEALKKQPGRTDFQRGRLMTLADGTLAVSSTGLQDSHVLSSMSRADCFIVLPQDSGDVPAHTLVEVQPFVGLI